MHIDIQTLNSSPGCDDSLNQYVRLAKIHELINQSDPIALKEHTLFERAIIVQGLKHLGRPTLKRNAQTTI